MPKNGTGFHPFFFIAFEEGVVGGCSPTPLLGLRRAKSMAYTFFQSRSTNLNNNICGPMDVYNPTLYFVGKFCR